MKTKFALIAIIAGTALMACQKEAEFGSVGQQEETRQARVTGVRNPATVTTGRTEQRFSYDVEGKLQSIHVAGRLQKRFIYDGEGRLDVLELPEAGEEIRFRYDIGMLPVDAIRVKIHANGMQEEVSDIVFTFDEFERKTSELETERATGTNTEFLFEYDEIDRLISTQKNINGEMSRLVRADGFIDGFSHIAGLDVLALEPGSTLQIGLPNRLMVDEASGHSEIEFTYSLNRQQQPDMIAESTNGRRAVKSRVAY
jgi:YD repeat-containing protein